MNMELDVSSRSFGNVESFDRVFHCGNVLREVPNCQCSEAGAGRYRRSLEATAERLNYASETGRIEVLDLEDSSFEAFLLDVLRLFSHTRLGRWLRRRGSM